MKDQNKYKDDKFFKLDDAYVEPYHYYVNFKPFGIHKVLSWGLEYYSYVSYILSTLKDLKFSTLLDVGCGDGFLLNSLSQEQTNFDSMTGIDLSDKAIAHANSFRRSSKVNFIVEDVSKLDKQFDVVTFIEVMEHIGDDVMNEFMNGLKQKVVPGGHLVVSVPSVNVEIIPTHHRHYTLDLLKSHVGDGFELVSCKYIFKRNLLFKLVNGLLINRFFIMRHQGIVDFLFKLGQKCFDANEDNCVHICAVFRKV